MLFTVADALEAVGAPPHTRLAAPTRGSVLRYTRTLCRHSAALPTFPRPTLSDFRLLEEIGRAEDVARRHQPPPARPQLPPARGSLVYQASLRSVKLLIMPPGRVGCGSGRGVGRGVVHVSPTRPTTQALTEYRIRTRCFTWKLY